MTFEARGNLAGKHEKMRGVKKEGWNSECPGFESFHVFHRLHVFLLKRTATEDGSLDCN
jgi:hypothetical protein